MPTDCPTLVLTECLLIYLHNKESEQILKWLPVYFNDSPYLSAMNYEMIEPFDSFGQTMIQNLMDRGCDLFGIEGCPTVKSQLERIHECWGADAKAECIPMDKLYDNKLDREERRRVETLEIFDEFEEWVLLQSHYCICFAQLLKKDCDV